MSKNRQLTRPQGQPPATVERHRIEKRFSGPLPPPEDFAAYDQTLPGCAERILRMAAGQATHRQALEIQLTLNAGRRESQGMWFALITTIAALVVVGYCSLQSRPVPPGVLVGISLFIAYFLGRSVKGLLWKKRDRD